ncbi:MAG: protein translocase subunit SecDF, partial [Lentisphaerae bacterium]
FDRIRENLKINDELKDKKSFTEVCNQSINETLSRTVLTSLTTFLVVIVLYFIGGGAVNDFSVVMLAGVVFGTYSSIFIATPVMIFFHQYVERVMSEAHELIVEEEIAERKGRKRKAGKQAQQEPA